jgi:hypothetical protein
LNEKIEEDQQFKLHFIFPLAEASGESGERVLIISAILRLTPLPKHVIKPPSAESKLQRY